MNWLSSLLGCRHSRTTFPQKRRERSTTSAIPVGSVYISCLDCGQEIAYDWDQMRPLPQRTRFSRWVRRKTSPVHAGAD
ncbi:MAG: hypothetical protein SFV54_13570 [Bryobacteraceae bacterium]|nr:hypothetical protein [Bryobacteraceae bacterium]